MRVVSTAAKLAEDAPQLIEIVLYLRRRAESATHRDLAPEPFSNAHTASIREQLDAHYGTSDPPSLARSRTYAPAHRLRGLAAAIATVRQALEYLEASVSAGYAPSAYAVRSTPPSLLPLPPTLSPDDRSRSGTATDR